ncbi:hypothetical protein ACSYAD_33980 [Acaryochloris marina NIES-2412]|uniref:hypothetical protein n=1 Tax=Acaryochloris marina TaxID=155978 RepID=UPI004058E5CD
MSITFRNSKPGIGSFIPVFILRLGLVGWGFWLMADGLAGPAPLTGRLRLEAPPFRPIVEMSKAIIHDPVAKDVLHHGSLVCIFAGAGVIGLRYVASVLSANEVKDGSGDVD